MGDNSPPAPSIQQDERASLTSRVIPQMTLSTEDSPLTRPLPPIQTTNPTERALQRFAIEGNVVITGGAGTLALTSAHALLEHGASGICLMDLQTTLDSSSTSIQELQSAFPTTPIHTIAVDVTSSTAVESAFTQASTLFKSIDILICFAGVVSCVPSQDVTQTQFAKVLDVNLTGSFLCAQVAAKYMINSGRGGSILFTASVSGAKTNFPQPQAAYNVSKAGVRHLTKNLAAEWAVHGIRVNCLSPGYMDTVLNAGDSLKGVRDIWAGGNPMGRMGDVEEVTGAVVLLCSKRAGRYMTGSEVTVDGGWSCF